LGYFNDFGGGLVLDYGATRNLLKNIDTISSEHSVIAEWNMNKYYEIEQYGIYKNPVTASNTPVYNASSSEILSGDNYIIYDDNTVKRAASQEYFSSLSSIFKPNRPNPGIVLLQKYGNNLIVGNATNIKQDNINSASPRFYPFSYSREYDYFNSAKVMGSTLDTNGVVMENGNISAANPFVVYNETLPCNKITIKVQNHLTSPDQFAIQFLKSGSWQTAVSVREPGGASAYFSNGICDIYYYNNSWSKTVRRVDDLNQLTSVSPTQLIKIDGVRLLVFNMNVKNIQNNGGTTKPKNPGGLEVIEISPRLEMDLTQYTESFSFNSSIGDTTNIGLPVGSVVSSTGQLALSNEENQFLFSSTLNDLNMLNPDVKFTFYQIIDSPGITASVIPLKVMYSNEWNVAEDYSVSVGIEDGMKYLRQTQAPDLFLKGYGKGNKLSFIILSLLDNSGFSGYEFKKSYGPNSKNEDVVIRNFFCKKEQTVAEVLESLAVATQCCFFYDNEGSLNVFTKERLSQKVSIQDSAQQINTNPDPYKYVWYSNNWFFYGGNTDALPYETEWTYSDYYGFWVSQDHPVPAQLPGTDFWMIFDEDYTKSGGGNASEYNYTASYRTNVMSYGENKINPVTDGDIRYHSFGPRKVPGINNIPSNVLNQLTQDFPAAALAFSNYTYATKILWTPGQDNSSVMGAANLTLDLGNRRLKDVFDKQYVALNEDEAVRNIYQSTNISSSWTGGAAAALAAKKDLIIFIDKNEGYTIPDYEGTVLIDKEYIKYRGKLYSVNGNLRIIFSEEEFQEIIRFIPSGGSIAFIGLVVDVELNIVSKSEDSYTYEVVGDGRAKLGSAIESHYSLAENSDGISPSKTFKLSLGETKNYSVPGNIKATTKFNFLDQSKFKSAKNSLGTLSFSNLESYLGFLKLDGPQSPAEDINIINKLDQGAPGVVDLLNNMNKQVDDIVPNDPKYPERSFDPFVYMQGERNLYGQYLDLPFVPNSISTRMRLFSSTKKRKNDQYVMSTNSSIAGIGFGLNGNNEGYYLEVESIGSGKDSVAKQAAKNNLRFYRISLNKDGKYQPELLLKAPVGAQTVSNTEVQVLKNTNVADPVFELEIQIVKYNNGTEYTIFYGNTEIGSYTEKLEDAVAVNGSRVFMFVRNDSQAIYEWFAAAARPARAPLKGYFKSKTALDQAIQSGVIPVNKDYLFKDDAIKYYFNDFARLVRQVKEYEIRFEAPAFSSALIDVSKVNSQYMIKKYEPTSFGAKIIVVNTSSGPILLGEESSLPLYIVGIGVEELSSGTITMKDYFDNVDEKKRKVADRERNLSIYGSQSFNLDSQYIQTTSQAKNLMKWIIKYCGRQRLKLSMEIYPNPLLELGDKVRIYDKSRGYVQDEPNFGDRVFAISSISHAVTSNGPSMNIEIIEVGE
jgi:hypothetical protein